jgi:7,8-dihydropterin-6-yl-methyl-4-(beta-D-ribofuranosyl)aminobenzene 5'-phosphate synthase
MPIKITIIYDNTRRRSEFIADWGFSCLIETDNHIILFDTGTKPNILLHNMKKLGFDPVLPDIIFVSHQHGDHMGGLSTVMDLNPYARVFVPIEIGCSIYKNDVQVLNQATKISNNLFSSGLLTCENRKGLLEQSLFLKTDKGMIVIAGCSHSGVRQILEKCKQFGEPYALIGGLHGFNEFDLLNDLEVICPTHCTKHIKEIKRRFPGKYVEGGVGQVIKR